MLSGEVRRGGVRYGGVRDGMARLGVVRWGLEWRGKVGFGMVRAYAEIDGRSEIFSLPAFFCERWSWLIQS